MSAKDLLKRLLHPVRTTIGRFAVSPLESRVVNLEEIMTDLQLTNRLIYKAAAFIAADKIEGDYLEFGVYTGGSFIMAFKCIREAFKRASTPGIWNTEQDCIERNELWQKMRFFAFDSFQGLPRPSGVNARSRDFVDGKFACPEDVFKQIISGHDVPLGRVITVPGWFKDTLKSAIEKYCIRSAAIVYVDSDLYESAKSVLDAITPIVVDGTVIIFDDWYNFRGDPNLGEQRACREWLETHLEFSLTEYQKEGPWKNSFIAHRRGRPVAGKALSDRRQEAFKR